jgi:sulfur transfer protein SufE
LEEELKKFNHAYMPKVGTMTAIRDLITKVRHSKYIYEFDIKGFFNNVSINDTIAKLRERGMSEMRFTLRKILESCPANIGET